MSSQSCLVDPSDNCSGSWFVAGFVSAEMVSTFLALNALSGRAAVRPLTGHTVDGKYLLPDQVAKRTPHSYVRRKMVKTLDPGYRNGCGGTIDQPSHPRFRILVCHDAGVCPGETGQPRRKGTPKCVVLPEIAVPAAFGWAFAARDQLSDPTTAAVLPKASAAKNPVSRA